MDADTKTIVLVEDDTFLGKLVLQRLVASGYQVTSVKDGESALQFITEHPPALILLDLVLPGFGGFELIAKLRQSAATKDIPFMVLSNSEESESRRRAEEMSASGYLVKAQSSPAAIVEAVNSFFAAQERK